MLLPKVWRMFGMGSWRHGSVIKSICCSSRGPWFCFHQLLIPAHNCVQLQLQGVLCPLLRVPAHTLHSLIQIHEGCLCVCTSVEVWLERWLRVVKSTCCSWKDCRSVPRTHVKQLMTSCYSTRGSNTFFWTSQELGLTCIHTHSTHIHIVKIIKNLL